MNRDAKDAAPLPVGGCLPCDRGTWRVTARAGAKTRAALLGTVFLLSCPLPLRAQTPQNQGTTGEGSASQGTGIRNGEWSSVAGTVRLAAADEAVVSPISIPVPAGAGQVPAGQVPASEAAPTLPPRGSVPRPGQLSPNPEKPSLGNINVSPTPPVNASGIHEGDLFTLTDTPLAAFGKKMADIGIYANGYYVSTLYANVSGGQTTGTVGLGRFIYGLDFDLEKLAHVPGAAVHIQLDSDYGGLNRGVNTYSGSLLGFISTQGPDHQTRLAEFSYDQHLLDDHLRFVVGRTSLGDFFATSPLYCQFAVAICQNITPYVWSNNSNAPFEPIATWAGEIEVLPTKHTYLRFGAQQDQTASYRHGGFPWDGGWSTKNSDGVFIPVETGYETTPYEARYSGRYAVGYFHDTSTFSDPRYNTTGGKMAFVGGTPLTTNASDDIYGQFQQVIFRPDPKSQRALHVLGAVSFNTTGNTDIQSYFQLGLFFRSPFASRPDDVAGIMATDFQINHRFTGALNDRIAAQRLTGNVSNTEQIVEVNYGVSFAPGIVFKPYAYYTWHPDQLGYATNPQPRIGNAVGIGAQLFFSLNYALGLPAFFRPN